MHLRDPTRDGEAKTGAGVTAVVRAAPEALEDPVTDLGWDPRTAVGDAHHVAARGVLARDDGHVAAPARGFAAGTRTVLDRVVQQVGDRAAQQRLVPAHRHLAVRLVANGHAALGGERAQ